jgi:hypothetical protein
MVSENVEEIVILEEDIDQQEEPTDERQLDNEEMEDWTQRIAIERGYYDGSIPSDIPAPPGLSPKRAELARFLEWHRRTVTEIEHLEESHHRAVEALGGERTTKKKIDALLEADVAAVLKFALGGEAITPKKLRAFERHQLEQKLKDDKHAAEVASMTLREIDREIGIKTVGLKFLEARTDGFIKSAIVEAARESGLGELYRQKINELRDVLMQLYGLGWIVGTHDGYRQMSVIEGVETQFPQFGLPAVGEDLKISADRKSLETAAAPWRRLATELLKNPNADAKAAYRHD